MSQSEILEHSGNWVEYKRLVLAELERANSNIVHLQEEVNLCRVEIGMLKVKSGFWGAVGGMVPAAIAIIFMLLK